MFFKIPEYVLQLLEQVHQGNIAQKQKYCVKELNTAWNKFLPSVLTQFPIVAKKNKKVKQYSLHSTRLRYFGLNKYSYRTAFGL